MARAGITVGPMEHTGEHVVGEHVIGQGRTQAHSPWRVVLIITMSAVTQANSADIYSCLEYGPTQIVGTLVRQTFAGPPDYESVTKGDEPQVIWLLQLDRRVCVDANARYPREPTEMEVELALPSNGYAQYRHLLGRKIVASGELIHGGANYRKRLVLKADDLSPTSATATR